jgi:hypothetical protein
VAQDLEDLERRVVFRFQLGYAVEQGDRSRMPITGAVYEDNRDTRLYTLGDAVAGTRGILARPLSSYVAARFRFDQDQRPDSDGDGIPDPTSIPSIYDQSELGGAVFVRHAYAQLAGVGPSWLRSLRVRAGRQYRYGVGVAHFDGVTASFETRALEIGGHVGRRVVLYTSDQYDTTGATALSPTFDDPGLMAGLSTRIRLQSVTRAPVVIRGDTLTVDDVSHLHGSLAIDLRPDVTVVGEARTRAGKLARATGSIRARLSDVTILSAEVDNRTREDWLYDVAVSGLNERSDPRLFLLLGPVLPRLRASGRAGTVLFSNFDVYVNAGFAAEHGDEGDSSFTPGYVEGGGAVAARFRGGLSAGADFTLRRFNRHEPPPENPTTHRRPLEDIGAWGETASRSGTLSLEYHVSEQRFGIESLFYFRSYDEIEHDGSPVITTTRLGGLIRIEGGIGRRLRTVLEYEITGLLGNVAAELAGLHSARILAEAVF